jgi:hypothetical protein
MSPSALGRRSPVTLIVIGFVAGALAVVTFHQIAIWLLTAAGAIQGSPYSLRPIAPFGVPQIINSMFWGGLWGCVFAMLAERFPRAWPLWLTGILFGLLGPLLVNWFVVAPIKGQPIAQGFNLARMWPGVVIAGLFGLGVAVFYDLLRRWGMGRRAF